MAHSLPHRCEKNFGLSSTHCALLRSPAEMTVNGILALLSGRYDHRHGMRCGRYGKPATTATILNEPTARFLSLFFRNA
jgi:hypothetical protein